MHVIKKMFFDWTPQNKANKNIVEKTMKWNSGEN